jgi:hypothetical protein
VQSLGPTEFHILHLCFHQSSSYLREAVQIVLSHCVVLTVQCPPIGSCLRTQFIPFCLHESKSIMTGLSPSIMMFDGLRSLCTSPNLCM